jgi:hypothetical protein
MSMVKRMMEAQDELRSLSLGVLKEVGLLTECESHADTYYDGEQGDLEDAYKLANSKVTRGDNELPSGMSRRDFTDAIKGTYEENAGIDYCPSCEKMMRD